MQGPPTARPRKRKTSEGIQTRHERRCASREGGACNCKPNYQATVYLAREKKRITKTFPSPAAAKAWRQDAYGAVRRGELRSPTKKTLSEVADDWFQKARTGAALSRSDRPYKPSTLREYESDFNTYIRPALGHVRVGDVDRRDVKRIVERMREDGWKPSTIRGTINALRVIYRQVIDDGDVTVNPTSNIKLPVGSTRRERAASPQEAARLLAALPESVRPIYATAFYAGLRRGELRALRWEDVDLSKRLIHVRRSWDDKEGEIAPKSAKGVRRVPVSEPLVCELSAHGLRTRRTQGLVFGRSESAPFTPSHVEDTAKGAWAAYNARMQAQARPESEWLRPIGLHECRHTAVTLMFEAGIPLEKIGDFIGHAGSYMTERYRHLLKDAEEDARRMLDAYLSGSQPSGRSASSGPRRP